MNIIDNIRTFFVNILEWIKGAFSITPTESIDPEVAFIAKLDTKGYTYDEDRDAFIPPKPHASWVLNETSCTYDAPVAYPSVTEYGDPVK